MSGEVWRPLGMDDGKAAEQYDALVDGVPTWMATSLWDWIQGQFSASNGGAALIRAIERQLRVSIREDMVRAYGYVEALQRHFRAPKSQLVLADLLLSMRIDPRSDLQFAEILIQSGSAWAVGKRAGRPGLVRRVPKGVQKAAEHVMASAGLAGLDLRRAWEQTFGVEPDPSDAYRLAVRAVEHAAIPVVVPEQNNATLGHVIGQLRADSDWSLPLAREDPTAPTSDTVLRLCQALWKGHHDRHGGNPQAPGTVSQEEAETAVTMAVPLVQWFASGMVARR